MYKIHQTGFQQDIPVFAFRSFIANGRKYERGSDFPWKEIGVTPEKVAVMFRTGLLRHRMTPGEVKATEMKRAEPAPAPAVDADDEPVDDLTDMTMDQLRTMAELVGAPKKTSKVEQRAAIREARAAS